MPAVLQGPITLKTLLHLQQHFINCAMTFRVEGQAMGYLWLAVVPQIYAIYTAELYPARTANPGERVIYTNGANAVAQKNQENFFAIQYCAHHIKNHMDRALIDQFYICLGDHHQDLCNQTATMANPTFLEVCAKAVAM